MPKRRTPPPKARKVAPRRKAKTQRPAARDRLARRGPEPVKAELVPIQAPGRTFPVEVDPLRIEETLRRIREELSHWAKKGRYTKVRFKFRGKPLLPDLPLAVVVAAEGVSFYWGGLLRALLVNFAGKTLFDVELVNDSAKKVQAGREALLSGDVDRALGFFQEAIDMARDNASAHLNLGIALKLKGELAAARASLARARALDETGPIGNEAERILATVPGPVTVAEAPAAG